jgi:transcriptional regulator with XRE-family HTH domain
MRMEKGWSQEIMAEKLDMAVTTYSNIERGITDIQASRLEQIAHVFDIELIDLFSFGEKGITSTGDNNQVYQHVENFYQHNIYQHVQTLISSQEAAAVELQKMANCIEQQTQEIAYLKEIIELMKK